MHNILSGYLWFSAAKEVIKLELNYYVVLISFWYVFSLSFIFCTRQLVMTFLEHPNEKEETFNHFKQVFFLLLVDVFFLVCAYLVFSYSEIVIFMYVYLIIKTICNFSMFQRKFFAVCRLNKLR